MRNKFIASTVSNSLSVDKGLQERILLEELEIYWKNTRPINTDTYFVNTPEGQKCIRRNIRLKSKKYSELKKLVKEKYVFIYKNLSKDQHHLHETVVEALHKSEMKEKKKEIEKLKSYQPEKKTKKTKGRQCTPDQIQRARDVPFNLIVEFKHKKVLCPFHNEKTPSMSWDTKRNRVKCFGCDINLNTIDFLMKSNQVNFTEAIHYLLRI